MVSADKLIDDETARRTGGVPLVVDGEAGVYSLARALTAGGGFEREVGEHLEGELGNAVRLRGGLLVPGEALFPSAALDVDTATGGAELVFERQPLPADPRRPAPRVQALGATVVDGPGKVKVFRITGGADITWPGENPGSDVADSDPVTDGEEIDVAMGIIPTAYSRQLAALNPATAGIVERELRAVAASAVDYAAINGQGSGSDEPTGLLQRTADINVVSIGTNGGPPTYATVTEVEEAPALDDVDELAPGWITTPEVRRTLRETAVLADTGAGPVWRGGRVLGRRGEVSTQVPSNLTKGTGTGLHAILYSADWANLVIHLLAVEVVTDEFSLKAQGVIEATLFLHVGIGLLHPESFAVVVDAATS